MLGSALDVTFTLNIAGLATQITITDEAPLVDTQKTAVATVVSQQQIDSLPINLRNFISFSVITSGVTTDRTPQQGASVTSGLTFAGQRARSASSRSSPTPIRLNSAKPRVALSTS